MIKIENLKKFYGKTCVIDDVSLEVKQGEIFAIVGRSGAGKSTLLRCINGLEDYQEGSLKVEGREVRELNAAQIRELRKNIGMIFQHFNLLSSRTVYDNVAHRRAKRRHTVSILGIFKGSHEAPRRRAFGARGACR